MNLFKKRIFAGLLLLAYHARNVLKYKNQNSLALDQNGKFSFALVVEIPAEVRYTSGTLQGKEVVAVMIQGIGHSAIRVADLEKSVAFYKDVLGFPEAFRLEKPEGGVAAVYLYIAPDQFIELFPDGKQGPRPTFEEVGHQHMCYIVEDARAAMEELKAKGAPIDGNLRIGLAKCPVFLTHDPDGNAIEIMSLPPECMQYQASKRLSGQ